MEDSKADSRHIRGGLTHFLNSFLLLLVKISEPLYSFVSDKIFVDYFPVTYREVYRTVSGEAELRIPAPPFKKY